MPTPLLAILGVAIVAVVIFGLVTGKIVAGSRGLRANYYSKKDNPFLYYGFLAIYSVIAVFILRHLL